MLRAILLKCCLLLKVDMIFERLIYLYYNIKESRYQNKFGENFSFVNQGCGGFDIVGSPCDFKIGYGSHIKSNTFIECSGGVTIGDYFHTGRGLTIFSADHNWKNPKKIPYDEVTIKKPVIIGDFVWCGANVTILPGTVIGEGCVIAAGTIVRGNIPPFSVLSGNPCKVVGKRNEGIYRNLKNKKSFF